MFNHALLIHPCSQSSTPAQSQLPGTVLVEFIFKGALYGIEPSTRKGKIWPTREEAAPSVPKNILLNLNQTRTRATLFQSITDVSTTALFRITFKSHELKNSNNSYHAGRLSCQLLQFCPSLGCATSLTSTRYF